MTVLAGSASYPKPKIQIHQPSAIIKTMVQNGLSEIIKAAEERLRSAKRAKIRSTASLKNAEAAFDSARKFLNVASRNLDDAKRDNDEADNDLKDAHSALEAVNSKWEIIELGNSDEEDAVAEGVTAGPPQVNTADTDEDDDPITEADLNSLKPGSRVIIYEYHNGSYFNATIIKLGSNTKQGQFQIHIDGKKKTSRDWVSETSIARIL
jgi:hypothetical protein